MDGITGNMSNSEYMQMLQTFFAMGKGAAEGQVQAEARQRMMEANAKYAQTHDPSVFDGINPELAANLRGKLTEQQIKAEEFKKMAFENNRQMAVQQGHTSMAMLDYAIAHPEAREDLSKQFGINPVNMTDQNLKDMRDEAKNKIDFFSDPAKPNEYMDKAAMNPELGIRGPGDMAEAARDGRLAAGGWKIYQTKEAEKTNRAEKSATKITNIANGNALPDAVVTSQTEAALTAARALKSLDRVEAMTAKQGGPSETQGLVPSLIEGGEALRTKLPGASETTKQDVVDTATRTAAVTAANEELRNAFMAKSGGKGSPDAINERIGPFVLKESDSPEQRKGKINAARAILSEWSAGNVDAIKGGLNAVVPSTTPVPPKTASEKAIFDLVSKGVPYEQAKIRAKQLEGKK